MCVMWKWPSLIWCRTLTALLVILLILSNLSSLALAQPAETINYQGKLTDSSGVSVADGQYDMEFKLYTQASGGVAIWTETLTGTNQVTATSGLFSVMLGAVTPLTSVDFNQPLYLGVNIDSDGEMTPRKPLGTVPAAFEARQLGGVASSSFLRSDQDDTASGLINFTGGIIGSASSTIFVLSANTATTSNFVLNNQLFTDLTGTGLVNNGGVLTVSTSSLGLTSALEDLTDVSTMTENLGDLLYWDGSAWADLATSSLGIATSDLVGNIDVSGQTNLGVSATGLELSGDSIALSSGYEIPLTASTSNWHSFYNTPSTRITGGTGLSWAGNTLNLAINELSTDPGFGSGDFLVYYDDGGNTYKVNFDNLPGAGGGLTSLNGETDTAQSFATTSDTNVTLTVNSSGGTHTFSPGWTGTLAVNRGGTGLSATTENELLQLLQLQKPSSIK